MRCLRCLLQVLLVGGLIPLTSCKTRPWHVEPINTGGSTTGDGGAGGTNPTTGEGGNAPRCPQPCVVGKPAWFDGVSLFEIGPTADIQHRACPDFAPHPGSVGYADLTADLHTCPQCACSAPTCALPTEMSASPAKCPGINPVTPFDAPAEWQGCSADNAIAASVGCSGVSCLSLTVEAPTVEPCTPAELGSASPPAHSWSTMARECLISQSEEGCEAGELCPPLLPDGFQLCAYRFGDDAAFPCPDDEYTERMVVYAGVADTRACSPCECGDPDGDCSALVSVFTDDACGAPLASLTVSSAMATGCVDLPPGVALGSKEAALTVDEPGTCVPSGGQSSGEVLPAGPVTLCCQKPQEPPK